MHSVHKLCSDWHAPYTQCQWLPTPWAGEIRCSLLHFGTFIHALHNIFKHRLVWHHIPLIYTILIHVSHTYMHFEWNTFVRTGIYCDVHFAVNLNSNRTNIWSYKSNMRNVQSGGGGGVTRTRIENRRFTHSVSSPGRAYQVFNNSQMSAFEAFVTIRALASRLPPPFYAPVTNDVWKAPVHYNRLWSITEPIPNRPRLHRDAL